MITSDLSTDERLALYKDRAICLCLLRVALTPFEQQLILRLVYSAEATKPRDFAGRVFASTDKQHNVELTKAFFKKLVALDLVREEESKDEQ